MDAILDHIFPSACIICSAEGSDICIPCLRSLNSHKLQNHPWTCSLWDYHDERVETIMRHIKNHPNDRAARIIAHELRAKLQSEVASNSSFHSLQNVTIIPIPIARSRYRTRGYNQALLLAQPLGKLLKRSIREGILVKSRMTKKQGTTKNRAERLENLKDSFAIRNAAAIRGRDIMIVDDITTTGSTLFEARAALLRGGARAVVAVTIAN